MLMLINNWILLVSIPVQFPEFHDAAGLEI